MSLVATKIQEIRLKNPDFDKNEHRLSEYGAFDFFARQSETSPLLTEEMKRQAKDSAGKTFKVPVIDYDGEITISHTRTCTVADAENTSKLVGVTWQTYAGGFTMVPTLYNNNEIDYQNDFAKKLKKTARLFGAALDEAAIAALEANKSQAFAETLIYTETADVIKATFAQREDILGDINPIMEGNDFYGQLHLVGNTGLKSLVNKLAEKSVYNIVNKDLEWMDKKFHFSNRLANDEGDYATFYAVEDGNVDMLYRYDREAARGSKSGVHEFEVVNMPYINIPVGLHYYESVGDNSAIAGDASADMKCTIKEYYGFSVDVAFVTSYNSAIATRPNPIIKVGIAKGDSQVQQVAIANTIENPVNTKAVGA